MTRMNNKDAAREIIKFLIVLFEEWPHDKQGEPTPEYVARLAAKLDELFPVPESLEAAVREVSERFWQLFSQNLRRAFSEDATAIPLDSEAIDDFTELMCEAVAPLLAEKDEQDEQITKLESLINEVSETLAPLQISHRHLYPWGWLNKARAYFGKPPVEESPR